MNKNICRTLSSTKTKRYLSPLIEIYNVCVEAGFKASLPNTYIAPWESDEDSLEL